jgi:hypothetical protein
MSETPIAFVLNHQPVTLPPATPPAMSLLDWLRATGRTEATRARAASRAPRTRARSERVLSSRSTSAPTALHQTKMGRIALPRRAPEIRGNK